MSTQKMTLAAMRASLDAVIAAEAACLAEWKSWTATLPRRLNAEQRERSAYLRGRLAGLHQARREFEKRAPLHIIGSGAKHQRSDL